MHDTQWMFHVLLMGNWPKFQLLPKSPWILSCCCNGDSPSTQWARWFAAWGGGALTGPLPSCFPAPQRFCVELHSLPLLKCYWVACGFHSTHIPHCVFFFLIGNAKPWGYKGEKKAVCLTDRGMSFVRKKKSTRPQKKEACREHHVHMDARVLELWMIFNFFTLSLVIFKILTWTFTLENIYLEKKTHSLLLKYIGIDIIWYNLFLN